MSYVWVTDEPDLCIAVNGKKLEITERALIRYRSFTDRHPANPIVGLLNDKLKWYRDPQDGKHYKMI